MLRNIILKHNTVGFDGLARDLAWLLTIAYTYDIIDSIEEWMVANLINSFAKNPSTPATSATV